MDTERLRLRRFLPEDLDQYCRIMGQDEVSRQLPRGRGLTREETTGVMEHWADSWESKGFGAWAVVTKDNDTLIGHCGLNTVSEINQVEVLYALGEEHWGKGYATEAARASVDWGFQRLKLGEIIGLARTDNLASQKVLMNCGLREEDRLQLWGLDLVKFCRSARD